MNIGQKIKDHRRSKKISREDLANSLNLSVHAIAKYEQGQREPSFDVLQKIADALDVTIPELLGYPPQEIVYQDKPISEIPTTELLKELERRVSHEHRGEHQEV